ncbi:hypothetical protein, partial [Paractinoplanes hotanensis]
HNFTGAKVMRDLTVDTTHTYYVLAGNTPVLVHNTTCRVLPSTHTDEFIVLGRREDINAARDWDNHEVLSLPTGTWTPQQNDQWVAGAIAKRQKVYLATSPTRENLYNDGPYNAGMTVFGREIRQLKNAGYTIQGDYMYPSAR